MKALRSFTVRPSLPAELTALETLAMNLRWAWDNQTRDLFRWVDPEQWDASVHDPVRLLGLVPRERLESLAGDPGFMRFLDEVHTELSGYLSKPRWFQAREGTTALRSVAYFSPGVRHRRGAAPVLGRPRRARRRPSEGGLRSRRSARRRRALLPARLLPPGAVGRRLAAGALSRPRSVRDGGHVVRRRARASRSRRPAAHRPGVAGRRRPRAAVPPRRRRRREPGRDAPGHRPALRRRRRAPPAPGDPARHRRRARLQALGMSDTGVPHQRGPRRLPRPRAHPPGDRRSRAVVRRCHRGRAGRVDLHDAHAGARRHRPLPAGADREVLLRLGRRVRAHDRRS